MKLLVKLQKLKNPIINWLSIYYGVREAVGEGIAEKDFESLQKIEKPFDEKMKPLNEQYMKYRADKDEAGMQKISDQADILDSTMNVEVFHKY